MPLAATKPMSEVAIGLPALVALGPHAAASWTTRWYLPDLMPSNQPVEPTVACLPSTWVNVTVAPLIFCPLIGVSSAVARHCLGGGGGGGGAGSGSGFASTLVSAAGGVASGSGSLGGWGAGLLPPQA